MDYRTFPSHRAFYWAVLEAKSTSRLNQEHAGDQSKTRVTRQESDARGSGQPAEIGMPTDTAGEQMRFQSGGHTLVSNGLVASSKAGTEA